MKRQYRFFDMEDVVFDDKKTVRELVEYVFEQSGYYEPMGMDVVTVYDASKYYVVTDPSKKCKDELDPSGGNGFTIAYLKEDKFFFAEGGWGHHMIDMNAAKLIRDPININVIFNGFDHSVVIHGALTLGEIYSFLRDTTYISAEENKLLIGEREFLREKILDGRKVKRYDMRTRDQDISLREAVGDLLDPFLLIRN